MPPHRVQRNADPEYYTRFWDPALRVVGALSGAKVIGLAAGTGGQACTDFLRTAPHTVAVHE